MMPEKRRIPTIVLVVVASASLFHELDSRQNHIRFENIHLPACYY